MSEKTAAPVHASVLLVGWRLDPKNKQTYLVRNHSVRLQSQGLGAKSVHSTIKT